MGNINKHTVTQNTIYPKWPEKEERRKPLQRRDLDLDPPREPPRRRRRPRRERLRKPREPPRLARNGKSGRVPAREPLVASERRTSERASPARSSPRNNLTSPEEE